MLQVLSPTTCQFPTEPVLTETLTPNMFYRRTFTDFRDDEVPIKNTTEHYQLYTKIGRGTFGTVRLARRLQNRQMVALKTVKGVEKFNPLHLREVQFAIHVPDHANLVRFVDMFVDGTTRHLNFAMEVMTMSMHDLISGRKGRPLEASVVKELSLDVLRGLSHVHAHQFVHRDLKPENILINWSEDKLVAKLADFGLSRDMRAPDFDKAWTGYVATRWYRAPEQLMELGNHGFPLDIWAFGCVFGELCNLRPLFPGRESHDMLRIQLHYLGSPDRDWKHAYYFASDVQRSSNLIKIQELKRFEEVIFACLNWQAEKRPSPDQAAYMLNPQKLKSHYKSYGIF